MGRLRCTAVILLLPAPRLLLERHLVRLLLVVLLLWGLLVGGVVLLRRGCPHVLLEGLLLEWL